MIASRIPSPGIIALSIGGSVLLGVLAMVALAVMGAAGLVGAALAFYAFPVAFFAPTPRNYWFLLLISAALAAAPAISFAVQVLRPPRVQGREWINGEWAPIVPPEPLEALTTSAVIWVVMFPIILGALVLLKRIGTAAKNQL
jgi:hypothetical protein